LIAVGWMLRYPHDRSNKRKEKGEGDTMAQQSWLAIAREADTAFRIQERLQALAKCKPWPVQTADKEHRVP